MWDKTYHCIRLRRWCSPAKTINPSPPVADTGLGKEGTILTCTCNAITTTGYRCVLIPLTMLLLQVKYKIRAVRDSHRSGRKIKDISGTIID